MEHGNRLVHPPFSLYSFSSFERTFPSTFFQVACNMQHATFKAFHPPDVVSRTKANLCMQLHLAIVVDVISLGPLHTVIFVVKQSECPDTVSYQHCLERVDLQQGNIKPTSECRTKKVNDTVYIVAH